MENTPKNIFILEDGKYKEITNTEHSRRRKNENAYKKRKFIRMGNCLMEVTYENYKKYYKSKEHEEYVEQRDEDHGVILVPEIPEFCKLKIEVNALNEEEQREIQRYIRKVFEVLSYFDKKDQEIIRAMMYARLLRENGVSILFEKENIDTAYMSSELLLALSGAQAQEESISISKNMRWSIERRMKNGTFLAGSTPYGYKIENGEFVIV